MSGVQTYSALCLAAKNEEKRQSQLWKREKYRKETPTSGKVPRKFDAQPTSHYTQKKSSNTVMVSTGVQWPAGSPPLTSPTTACIDQVEEGAHEVARETTELELESNPHMYSALSSTLPRKYEKGGSAKPDLAGELPRNACAITIDKMGNRQASDSMIIDCYSP